METKIKLLGVNILKIDVDYLISFIFDSIKYNKKKVISYINIHGLNLAFDSENFKEILNDSDIVYCDGIGVVLASKLKHGKKGLDLNNRMTCPDFIDKILTLAEEKKERVFVIGGSQSMIDKLQIKVNSLYPNLEFQCNHGYFQKNNYENTEINRAINQFKPQILFVGFGMPIQEEWINNNVELLEANIFYSVGACFEFYVNEVYRAPKWINDIGLEWFIRFIASPKRLWKRYVLGIPVFLFRLLKN